MMIAIGAWNEGIGEIKCVEQKKQQVAGGKMIKQEK